MPKMPIDLGKSDGCCGPCPAPRSDRKYYPSVYLDGIEDLPESGVITFRFETRRKTTTELPKDGETTHECCIDLISIESLKGDKKAKVDDSESTGDALDRLRQEVEDAKESEDY